MKPTPTSKKISLATKTSAPDAQTRRLVTKAKPAEREGKIDLMKGALAPVAQNRRQTTKAKLPEHEAPKISLTKKTSDPTTRAPSAPSVAPKIKFSKTPEAASVKVVAA